MSLSLSLAIYFIIWWLVLFTVLPIGVTTQGEENEVVPGTPESAPIAPQLGRKFLITTLVSAIIFGIFYGLVAYDVINIRDISVFTPGGAGS